MKLEEVHSNISSNLNYLRNKRGLNRRALSKKLFNTDLRVGNIESLRVKPTLDDLVLISDFFTISIDTLIKVDMKECWVESMECYIK